MPEISGMIQQFLEGNIKTLSSSEPVIESKTITENGTYTAPSGVDGYSPVVVNVSSSQLVIQEKIITENGTYTAPEGVDGYNPITVDVPTPEPVLDSITITENGTYTPSSGVDGYDEIVVNIQGGVEVYTETYVGNGQRNHAITFQHEPKAILQITGAIDSSNICWTNNVITSECNKVRVSVGDSSQYTVNMELADDTLTLLQSNLDATANMNANGTTYTVTYLA